MFLSFWDPENRRPTVDLFADDPMDFEWLYRESLSVTLAPTPLRIASIEHLMEIKRAAARPKDLEEVARLAELRRNRSG